MTRLNDGVINSAAAGGIGAHGQSEQLQASSLDTYQLPTCLPELPSVSHFVARDHELRKMQGALANTERRRSVVLHGLGGTGKTQLTLEYIRRHQADYTAVIWWNARDETTINRSVSVTAERILRHHPGLSYLSAALESKSPDQVVQAVKRWLDEPENGSWLLVYDNYDNPLLDRRRAVDDLTAVNIGKYLPEMNRGAVIVTTRSSVVKLGSIIHLEKLGNINDCLKILELYSHRPNLQQDPSAIELARLLDGLPLALASAGYYLAQVSTSFAEYIHLYKQSWLSLQEEIPNLLSYDVVLYSTWNISYKQVEKLDLNAARLLQLWSYFDNNDLWYELLQDGRLRKTPWLQDIIRSELDFDKTIRLLCSHGLVDTKTSKSVSESQGYSAHACVHEWMTNVLNRDRDEALGRAAMDCIVSHVLSQSAPKHWLVRRRLLAHVDRCLALRGNFTFSDGDSYAMHNLGEFYADQGRLTDAETIYRRALEGYEKALGRDHTSTLCIVNNLSGLYKKQGKLAHAEKMYRQALEGYEKAYGPEHTSTLNTVNSLANLFRKLGKLEEAETMYQRALKGYEKALGTAAATYVPYLKTLENYGVLCKDTGRYQDASSFYGRALGGVGVVLGKDYERYMRISRRLKNIRDSSS